MKSRKPIIIGTLSLASILTGCSTSDEWACKVLKENQAGVAIEVMHETPPYHFTYIRARTLEGNIMEIVGGDPSKPKEVPPRDVALIAGQWCYARFVESYDIKKKSI